MLFFSGAAGAPTAGAPTLPLTHVATPLPWRYPFAHQTGEKIGHIHRGLGQEAEPAAASAPPAPAAAAEPRQRTPPADRRPLETAGRRCHRQETRQATFAAAAGRCQAAVAPAALPAHPLHRAKTNFENCAMYTASQALLLSQDIVDLWTRASSLLPKKARNMNECV